jgi:hypothetical protein
MLEREGVISVLPRRGRVVRQRYRVFFSTPMAALTQDDYETDRSVANQLFQALRHLAQSVYWAAEDIQSAEQFEAPDIATAKNLSALTASSTLVYLQQRKLTHPTSSLLEVGIALASKKPVTVFAPSEDILPYALRRGFEAVAADLAFGRFRFYRTDTVEEAIRLITVHGAELIGLDDDSTTTGDTS